MERKTRYTMVNKRGEELYHSDSFLGFIGSTIMAQLIGCFILVVVALVICGIASIFG